MFSHGHLGKLHESKFGHDVVSNSWNILKHQALIKKLPYMTLLYFPSYNVEQFNVNEVKMPNLHATPANSFKM